MPPKTNPKNLLNYAVGAAAAAGGWLFSMYVGPALWIPGLSSFLLILVFARSEFHPPYFQGAIAAIGGQVFMCLTAGIVTQLWSEISVDLVIFSLSILWLWSRPGLTATLCAGLVQVGALAYNTYVLTGHPVHSIVHKALLVHCTWRLLAIIGLVTGYLKLRQDELASAARRRRKAKKTKAKAKTIYENELAEDDTAED